MNYTNIGVYVEVNHGTRTVTFTNKCCVNPKCTHFKRPVTTGKYCNECGKRIQKVTHTEQRECDSEDFMEDTDYQYDNAVWPVPDLNVYLPNSTLGPLHRQHQENSDIDILAVSIDSEMLDDFRLEAANNELFMEAVKMMKSYFGDENVIVKVGVVRYEI